MSDLAAVLTRVALDDVFRRRLITEPEEALRGYHLDAADREALRVPGPDWLGLLGRAIRATEVPPGPAWADYAVPAGPASSPGGRLPDASVWLRLGERTTEAGSSWEVQLLAGKPEDAEGFVDLEIALRMLGDQVSATLRPLQTEPSVTPTRWDHRVAADAGWKVLEVPEEQRGAALLDLMLAVREPNPRPSPRAAPPLRPGGPHIRVVGLGITGIEHVTRETEAAVRRARRVYHVDAGLAAPAWLRATHSDVRPLFAETYVVGEARLSIYDRIAAEVLRAGLDVGDVVLAVQGHPMVFSYVPALLLDAGPLVGLEVQVLPGISADAVLLAELGIDPADHGLQAYECTDLLLRRRPIQSDVPLVLWQVGNLETRLHQARRSRPERLAGLVAWLTNFYPPLHPVTALHVSPHPGVPGWRRTLKLEDLPSIAGELHAAVTLYLPPVRRRPLADPYLAVRVDDPAYLGHITE
jgi:precorrin-2 methylase